MRVVCLPRGWGEEERGADLHMERFMLHELQHGSQSTTPGDREAGEGAGPLGPRESVNQWPSRLLTSVNQQVGMCNTHV